MPDTAPDDKPMAVPKKWARPKPEQAAPAPAASHASSHAVVDSATPVFRKWDKAAHGAHDAQQQPAAAPRMVGWGVKKAPAATPAAPAKNVEDLEREYLEARALTVDDARRAGWRPVENVAALHRSYRNKTQPGVVIPYFDPISGAPLTWDDQGVKQDFERVRLLADPPARGFAKPKKTKPVRYVQSKGSPVFAYFPLRTSIDWRVVRDDPGTPLVITEGEAKALCACVHNIETIALGGLSNFTNNGQFLPELEPFLTGGRKVIVCPDSDFADKPGVQAAVRRLIAELKKRDIALHVALLPHDTDNPVDGGAGKLGLDDAIKKLGVEAVIKILDQAPAATDFDTIIDLAPARLTENLEQLDEAFSASDLPLYQQSGRLVHVAAAGSCADEDDVHRAAQAHIIHGVTVPVCQQLAMRIVKFYKWTNKGPAPSECPTWLAEHYLQKTEGWQLNELKGIVGAPTIRADGTILQTPGYDKQSGILYIPNAEFPAILDNPTKEDAIVALESICNVVRGFEFATPEAGAVWVAAAMTAVVRRILRTAPMFAFSAPVMGAGKSLLAELISFIATGHEPAVMSQGSSPEEDSKRLLSALMRGDCVIQIDNCERPIEGDSFCSILTSPVWQSRILGRTEMSRVSTNTTFLATGNNLSFKGDMSTRALMCKLLPKAERPEERVYDWDARAETHTQRAHLVAAILTIIRAYFVAGQPPVTMKTFGRFEQWQDIVQAPLLWLGAPDPCKTRALVERNDPDRQIFGRLVYLWNTVYGPRAVRLKEVGELVARLSGHAPEARELYDMVCELSGGKGLEVYDALKFGKYLQAKEERLSDGLRFVRGEDRKNKVATWALVPA
jgi:hypothetical protein